MQHENIYVLIHGMAKQVTHPFLSVPRYPKIGDQGGMVYPFERLDEISSKLGQRLASMGQVAHRSQPAERKRGYDEPPIPEIQALI